MKKRTFNEMVEYFIEQVRQMKIKELDKMALIGMITMIQTEHEMQKHGKWLDATTLDNEFICWVCSECRHGADFVYEPYNYCPNCGARMDGE